MNLGIVYVAFGESYLPSLAKIIKLSRKHTDLPICVMTNTAPGNLFDGLDVTFKEFNLQQRENRFVKTQLHLHTPFTKTIYLDADTVIQNPGIERVGEMLDGADLVLNPFIFWKEGDPIPRIYNHLMCKLKVGLPIMVWNGAFIAFRQSTETTEFFERWHRNWMVGGCGREMHALACAIKSTGVNVRPLEDGFFEPERRNPSAVVQHDWSMPPSPDFYDVYNIPRPKRDCSFDRADDFNWVEYGS